MRILITGAGGPAAISVWKSLGTEHSLYMADIDPCAAGLYLVPPAQRFIVPKGESDTFAQTLFEFCKNNQIELVIPTVDSELAPLASALDEFLSANIKLPLCPHNVLEICRDKYALLTLCKGIIPIPEFILWEGNRQSLLLQNFPLFAKPRLGSGSNGVLSLSGSDNLLRLPADGSYLVQELLPGDEYSVDVYIHSSGFPVAAVPRLRMKIDSGIAVAACTQHIPELSAIAIKTALHIGVRYVANIQFKRGVDGQFKLLEINPRFPGTLPLTAAAGIDMPQLLIKDVKGEVFPKDMMSFRELMVVRYWTEHFCSPDEWKNLCHT